MIYTKEDFKRLWASGEITYEDLADCAKEWGLLQRPFRCAINDVARLVLKDAGCSVSAKKGWRMWPQEKPSHTGEHLVRGIGGLNNKLHYWVCLWIGEDKSEDKDLVNKFYYGGNEFRECQEFEFIDVNEL